MIDQIRDWMFFNYGFRVSKKIVWMLLILICLIVLLGLVLISNGGWGGGSGKAIDPDNLPVMPEMQKSATGWVAAPNVTGR